MEVVSLGTGTSYGIPIPGCRCRVCTSPDVRNRRNRCSIAISLPAGRLVIDTPPEFRLSCLRDGIHQVHALAFTHTHADHVMGMDDVRSFNYTMGIEMPIYAERPFLEDIQRIFRYVFIQSQEGGGKPKLTLNPIQPGVPFELLGATIEPLRVLHGEVPITAYRIGAFAYVTDVSTIPPETMARLYGLDTLIVSAIREQPHPTHFSIGQAVELAQQLQPRRTFLTHMTHDVDHEETQRRLPPDVFLSYDGMRLTLP